MTETIRTRTSTGLARTPPREIQLWNAGPNPTDYGVHKWTNRSIGEVVARYKARGNPLLIDIEHNGAQLAGGEPAVTGGYALLDVRGGEPWLVFEWSDYGREQISAGIRRFLSPEYDVDKNTGEIVALYRVSLVADPGTHHARVLATKPPDEAATRVALFAKVRALSGTRAERVFACLPTDALKRVVTSLQSTRRTTTSAPTIKRGTNMAEANDISQAIAQATEAGVPLSDEIKQWFQKLAAASVESATKLLGTLAKAAELVGAPDANGLTEREKAKCKAKGIDPAKYASVKARSFAGGK